MQQQRQESGSKTSTTKQGLHKAFSAIPSEQHQAISISKSASLKDAARLMQDHQIGSVIVVDGDASRKPVGIITDRDIALKATEGDGARLKVGDLMKASLKTIRSDSDPFEMARIMRENGVARLPLVDESGALVGVISARKLLQCFTRGLEDVLALGDLQKQNEMKTH